jgi:NitT/TauT family transport system permease protein
MNAHKGEAFLPVVGVVGLLAIWSLVTWRQWVDPVLLPSPLATFDSLWRGMDGGPLGFDFAKTVYRTAASTLIAAVIAIPLGIVLGSSERFYRSLEFVIDFFRSTPASAMFPLFLVLFALATRPRLQSRRSALSW